MQQEMFSSLLMMGGFMAVFYWLVLRPQQKKQAEHQQLMNALTVGDEVLMQSGVLGRIEALGDPFIALKIGDAVTIQVQRASVQKKLPKGTFDALMSPDAK